MLAPMRPTPTKAMRSELILKMCGPKPVALTVRTAGPKPFGERWASRFDALGQTVFHTCRRELFNVAQSDWPVNRRNKKGRSEIAPPKIKTDYFSSAA